MSDESVKSAVQALCQRIYERDGCVKPSVLIEEAKKDTGLAHSAFEWDKDKALEKYLLHQARNWIRVITIVHEERAEQLVHVPSVRAGEGEYKPAVVIVQHPSEFERAMDQALQKLSAARRAVDELRRVAEQSDGDDRSAMIAQISRGLDILSSALDMRH